jgi:hypothetical protein
MDLVWGIRQLKISQPFCAFSQINFVLLISRQGKVRLTKWYSPYTQKERTKVRILYCSLLGNRCSWVAVTVLCMLSCSGC